MKKSILAVMMVANCLSYALPTANPSDLISFEDSGRCAYCDLSGFMMTPKSRGAFDLTGANLMRAGIENRTDHMRQYSRFAYLKGNGCWLRDSDYSYSDFYMADLQNANFAYANLTAADFTGANLDNVSFLGSNLYRARISDDQLRKARDLCGSILPDGKTGRCGSDPNTPNRDR